MSRVRWNMLLIVVLVVVSIRSASAQEASVADLVRSLMHHAEAGIAAANMGLSRNGTGFLINENR